MEVDSIDESLAQCLMAKVAQPGAYLAPVDLTFRESAGADAFEAAMDMTSLAMAGLYGGRATVATDFQPNPYGHVRIFLQCKSLSSDILGALAQRLLEIETYRILALLGLPEAHRATPRVKALEEALIRISETMPKTEALDSDHKLLDDLTSLAARLEADAARSGYRFNASRAYREIVRQGLQTIREEPIDDVPTISSLLDLRVAPAMRTCAMLEKRQAALSEKLTRAANLLRTRVDLEIEKQNRDLLTSMNNRIRMQLRLQQNVDCLPVAAISYYIVGLVGYCVKGLSETKGVALDPTIATACLSFPSSLWSPIW